MLPPEEEEMQVNTCASTSCGRPPHVVGVHTGSPWTIAVAAAGGHAAMSAISGVPTHLVAGEVAAFTITAKDRAGNLTIGGDRVEAHLDSTVEGAPPAPPPPCPSPSLQTI